jgi:hypothetical protein
VVGVCDRKFNDGLLRGTSAIWLLQVRSAGCRNRSGGLKVFTHGRKNYKLTVWAGLGWWAKRAAENEGTK